MKKIYKSFIIPLIRIPQFILVLLLIALMLAMAYGIIIHEINLWKWSWKVALMLHIVVSYLIAVCYCHEEDSRWWPE